MHKTFDPTTGDHTPTHHVLPASGEVVLRIDPIDDDVDIHFVATEPETGNLLKTRCDDTRGRMACGSVIDFPDDPTGLAVLDFADYHPQYGVLLGNQVLVLWRGRVYDDGTFHFVTTLIGPPDTSIDAAANRNQLAITGKLPE